MTRFYCKAGLVQPCTLCLHPTRFNMALKFYVLFSCGPFRCSFIKEVSDFWLVFPFFRYWHHNWCCFESATFIQRFGYRSTFNERLQTQRVSYICSSLHQHLASTSLLMIRVLSEHIQHCKFVSVGKFKGIKKEPTTTWSTLCPFQSVSMDPVNEILCPLVGILIGVPVNMQDFIISSSVIASSYMRHLAALMISGAPPELSDQLTVQTFQLIFMSICSPRMS